MVSHAGTMLRVSDDAQQRDTDTTGEGEAPPAVPPTPFHELAAYVALPRLAGLELSPDGTRLVTAVSSLDPKGSRYVTALWEVDPAGERPARRLTRSAKGESGAAFLPDGTLLFGSARPDPQRADDTDDAVTALWALPPERGEARVVAHRPGGVSSVVTAARAATVVALSRVMPGADDDPDTDATHRKRRKEAKVTAVLHDAYPVRYWDSDLGPDAPRLFTGSWAPAGQPATGKPATGQPTTEGLAVSAEADLALRPLTGHVGHALRSSTISVAPDGSLAVVSWERPEGGGTARTTLVAVDLATGDRQVLLDEPDLEFSFPSISPDGRWLACHRYRRSTPQAPGDLTLAVAELPSRVDPAAAPLSYREVAPRWDRWPSHDRPSWTPDSRALVVTADEDGRCPVFRLDLATDGGSVAATDPANDTVTRLTADAAAYSDVRVSPDGRQLYALRLAIDAPATPVRLDATTAEQQPTLLPSPAPAPALPGRVEEVRTTAGDGTALRSWLCLPDDASASSPAPLLLWIHGGPLNSWNAWSWRWNPWLAVAQGYAVLLPDPALSTGYGRDFVARGWGSWGQAPYTDVLDLTDAALTRDDLDRERTAAMGGSFGGYLANWIGGHTDRFRAIVTHASLYALDQFAPTTDVASYWERELTPEMTLENSPHRFVEHWVTPTLVIHGDRDYRVPIGEALRLWWDLARRHTAEDGTMPHRFLYFPDENHWVLTPNHATVWYETVFAFLDHHVRGADLTVPELLR